MTDTNDNWFARALDDVKAHTPTEGYNVVAVNDYASPLDGDGGGGGLYLVSHHTDPADAEKARAAHETESGDTSHVYGPREPVENDARTGPSFMENEA